VWKAHCYHLLRVSLVATWLLGTILMPSRRAKITTRTVDALQPGALVWDTQIAGFGVCRQRRDRIYVLKTRVGARQR